MIRAALYISVIDERFGDQNDYALARDIKANCYKLG